MEKQEAAAERTQETETWSWEVCPSVEMCCCTQTRQSWPGRKCEGRFERRKCVWRSGVNGACHVIRHLLAPPTTPQSWTKMT